MESIRKMYRVDRREIAYFRFILEAADGIAMLRTIDARTGLVGLHIPPGREAECERVLQALRQEIRIDPVDPEEAELYCCDEFDQ